MSLFNLYITNIPFQSHCLCEFVADSLPPRQHFENDHRTKPHLVQFSGC